jgi:hypothetical protein
MRFLDATRSALTLLFSCLVVSASAFPQIQNGQITGVVSDRSGAAIPGASVRLTNPGIGYEVEVRSNDFGIYAISELIVGTYAASGGAPGFKTTSATNLSLSAGSVLHVDFKLEVGQRWEIVEVHDPGQLVNTENTHLAYTLTVDQIANLPLNGRNVYDLIQYQPGATHMKGVMGEQGADTVINGVRENFNGFLINGNANKGLSGGPVNTPILDAVQEVQVLTLNNTAEFGNSAGAITNLVTKSGSNELHASAWEFFRNDIFDANSFFANMLKQGKLPLRFNQFGATVGGPIHRDKLFFFAAYQGERFLTSSPGVAYVESPEFRLATISAFPNAVSSLLYSNFAPAGQNTPFATLREYIGNFDSRFSTFADYLCPANTDGNTGTPGVISRKFATLFGVEQADIDLMNSPRGNCAGGSPYAAPMSGSFNRDASFVETVLDPHKSQSGEGLFDGNEASLRLDYNLGHTDRIFTQSNWARSSDKYSSVNDLRGFGSPLTLTTPNFQISIIHTFRPTLLNEFRAGYALNESVNTVPLPGVPLIVPDDILTGFGADEGVPLNSRENIYNYSDLISLNHGKHDIKAGLEVERNIENSDVNAGRPGYEFFDSLFFAIDAPYLEDVGVDPGFASLEPAHLATSVRHWRDWTVGAYFQDNWSLSRRLKLNLGIRYDLFTRNSELNDLATTFMKGPGNDFVDDISTGQGQIKSASLPCPGDPRAVLAGECGPGGFAPARNLGRGDHNNLAPQIGFAWDVFGDGKSSVRGGFGISYEGSLQKRLSLTRWNPPYYSLNRESNYLDGDSDVNVVYGPVDGARPTFQGPASPAQQSGTGAQATGNISGWAPSNPQLSGFTSIVFPEGLRDPYIRNWFLGVQRELPSQLVVEINYVGTSGQKLYRADDVNRLPGGSLPEGTCTNDNFGRRLCSQIDTTKAPNGLLINPRGTLNPNYGRLRVWENAANSIYNAMQISIKKRPIHGLQLDANYTYGHSVDTDSTWQSGGTTANGAAAGDALTTDPTQPDLDRGNSVFDIRHRLAFYYVWELPFFRNRHDPTAAIFRGWQWEGLWSFQSGAHWSPFNPDPSLLKPAEGFPDACSTATFASTHCVNQGGDYNLDGTSNDRPDAMASRIHVTPSMWANGFNLPSSFFSAPCLGCTGNLGRNTFLGPGLWTADVSLVKNIHVREQLHLQIRAEAFNVFNHTNFLLGNNSAIHDSVFGQAAGTMPPRNLQFGVKLGF